MKGMVHSLLEVIEKKYLQAIMYYLLLQELLTLYLPMTFYLITHVHQ